MMLKRLPLLILFMGYSATVQGQNAWKIFDFSRLVQENEALDGSYHRFLDESSASMGLYSLKSASMDNQPVHDRDEVYFVVEGDAHLIAGDDTMRVRPGTVIYVKAETAHRFIRITDNLQVLVIFSNAPSSPDDPLWCAFETGEHAEMHHSAKHTSTFLNVTTMSAGFYSFSGSPTTDKFVAAVNDMISIVINGEGTLNTGEEQFPLKPGSVFFTGRGNSYSITRFDDSMRLLNLQLK